MKSIASAGDGKLYAAGRFGDIFRSTDDGEHWTSFHLLDGETPIRKLLVDPLSMVSLRPITLPNGRVIFPKKENKIHIFAATRDGLYESNDSALTWSKISAFSGKDLTDIAFDPSDSHTLFLAGKEGVWKWKPAIPVEPTAVPPAGKEGVWKWKRNAVGSQLIQILDKNTRIDANKTIQDFNGTAIAINNSNIVIKFHHGQAGSETGYVLLYDRSLSRWKNITPTGKNNDLETQRHWANSIAIDPYHPNVILVGGTHLLRTEDKGNSWSNSIPGLHDDIQSIIFDPTITGRVYAATDGGIFRSDNSGKDWSDDPADSSKESISQNIDTGKNLNLNLVTSQPFSIGMQDHTILGTFDHWGHMGVRKEFSMLWEAVAMGNWEWASICSDPYIKNRFYYLKSNNPFGYRIFSSDFGYTGQSGHMSNFHVYSKLSHMVHLPISIYNSGDTNHTIMVVEQNGSNYTLMVTHDGDKSPQQDPNKTWINQPTWNPAKICNGGICTDIESNNNPIAQVVNAPGNPKKAYAITRNGDHLWVNNNILIDGGWSDINQSSSPILSSVCNRNGGIRQLLIDPEDDKKLYVLGSGDSPQCNFLALSSDSGMSWNILD